MKRPLIFAHRGASRQAPENTLPAFAAAIEAGVDGVELDVQYSSDGQLVVFHSPTLEASSNGSGRVSSHTLAELRELDAGSWFDPRFAGTRIPLLDEVLDLLRGKCRITIELKALESGHSGMGVDVVAAVRARSMSEQVILSSFNALVLRRARKAGPEMAGGLMLAPELPRWMRSTFAIRWSGANALHPEAVMVDEEFMKRARRLGMAVRPWTANDEVEVRRLAALGVDAIITDVPDQARTWLC